MRILLSSNSPWSKTGYGVQVSSLVPRLGALDTVGAPENVAIFAWYGVQGGLTQWGPHLMYPGHGHAYGTDIIGKHARHFGADVVITLIDVWTQFGVGERVAPAKWCVPGDTLVTLADGSQAPIKVLHDAGNIGHPVMGHDGKGQATGTIHAYHYMGIKPILEVETVTGRILRITRDSGVYVQRASRTFWIEAACLVPGDMVLCVTGNHISQEGIYDKLGEVAHAGMAVSRRYAGDGVCVPGRNNGRGRDDWPARTHQAAHVEERRGAGVQDSATGGGGLQQQRAAGGVVAESRGLSDERQGQATGAHQLLCGGDWLPHVWRATAATPVPDCEEGSSVVADGIYRLSAEGVGRATQPAVLDARSRDLADAPRTQLEEVRAVRETGVSEPVYDLTTSTHNFFANGVLIHNCPWFPVDTQPVSPKVLDALGDATLPVVYSRFGERMLKEAGLRCAYVPHGVEPEIYRILPEEPVATFRHDVLRDAEHVTVMVAANKGFDRKAFQINLRAWAEFAQDEPDAVLYLHTDPTTQAQGVDLLALTEHLGIRERVIFPDRYTYYLGFPAEYMALLYNAADVLLAASMTEGFGIPIVEAQACGTPVIVTDFASMPELVRWGMAVRPADVFWADGLRSWWAWPDWKLIRQALEETKWTKRRAAQDMGQTISAAIHHEFSWDAVVERHWRPVLEEVERGQG